jgi:hypothetical protein
MALPARREQSLDLALRYAPSYLYKGLIVTGDECVYVDGKPMPGMRARDYSAADVTMVEIYASGSGDEGMANTPLLRQAFPTPCGVWAHMDSVNSGKGYFRYSVRPRPGIVSFVWISNIDRTRRRSATKCTPRSR